VYYLGTLFYFLIILTLRFRVREQPLSETASIWNSDRGRAFWKASISSGQNYSQDSTNQKGTRTFLEVGGGQVGRELRMVNKRIRNFDQQQ
jgi:hypothetical protein